MSEIANKSDRRARCCTTSDLQFKKWQYRGKIGSTQWMKMVIVLSKGFSAVEPFGRSKCVEKFMQNNVWNYKIEPKEKNKSTKKTNRQKLEMYDSLRCFFMLRIISLFFAIAWTQTESIWASIKSRFTRCGFKWIKKERVESLSCILLKRVAHSCALARLRARTLTMPASQTNIQFRFQLFDFVDFKRGSMFVHRSRKYYIFIDTVNKTRTGSFEQIMFVCMCNCFSH